MAHDQDLEKQSAGIAAASLVKNGMNVGLGTGSTSAYAVKELGRRMKEEGLRFVGVCTSSATESLAKQLGIPLKELDGETHLDIYIDGADQIDPKGSMVKGGGGALLREKMVALTADFHVIMVDGSKQKTILGVDFPLPVEIVAFGHEKTIARLAAIPGCNPKLRHKEGAPFLSDGGNYIVDCDFPEGIADPEAMHTLIKLQTGVVETGLFLSLCDRLICGTGKETKQTDFDHKG